MSWNVGVIISLVVRKLTYRIPIFPANVEEVLFMTHHELPGSIIALLLAVGTLMACSSTPSDTTPNGSAGSSGASNGGAGASSNGGAVNAGGEAGESGGSGGSAGTGGGTAGTGGGTAGTGGGTAGTGGGTAGASGSGGAAVSFCDELDDPHELIADRRFQRGFVAADADHKPIGPIATGFCSAPPIWSIGQYDSLGDLSKSPLQTLPNGSVRWSNPYGRVTVGHVGSSDADAAFAVWGFQEYGGQYHTPSPERVWVHLLAEQRMSPPGTTRPGCPPISQLSKLDLKMGVKLLKNDPHHIAGYDPSKHTAQFLVYFTVQNLNQSSPGYGDYLWFGLMPYDERYPVPGLFILGDLGGQMGTGKLIYNIGASPFTSTPVTAGGAEQMFAKDLLPDVKAALLEAWKRGYLPDSNVLSDYKIGGMNIGWEVPGLNDVEMRVRDLSLRYTLKSTAAVTFDFDTDGDREGWTAHNLEELSGGPTKGAWILRVPGDNPYIVSPPLALDAATHKVLHIVYANDHNPVSTAKMQVYFDRFGERGFREAWSVTVPINNGGGFSAIDIDMSANPGWAGEIHQIRIDPVTSGDGHAVAFDQISI